MGTGGGALRRLYAVNGTLKPGERVACAGARAGIVASSFGAWTGTGKPAHGWTLVGGGSFRSHEDLDRAPPPSAKARHQWSPNYRSAAPCNSAAQSDRGRHQRVRAPA